MRLKKHFKTGTVSIGEGEQRQSLDAIQWKPAGAVLVSLEEGSGGGSDKEIELVQGNLVEFSAEGSSLLAVKPGYPRLKRTEGKESDRVVVDLEPMITVSDDGWSVFLQLFPPFDGALLPGLEDILAMLESEQVRWGIREKKIVEALARAENERCIIKEEVIARGRLPVNGVDGRLRLEFCNQVVAGVEDEDGRMDFRERNIFVGVEAGDLLATVIPATAGLAGKNIHGHEIPQSPGKELTITPSPDIVFDREKGEIRAAISGVVSAVNDTSVRVSDKQVVSGDIDYGTGNVDVRGGLEVSGSVKPGFKLNAGADLVIGGAVEMAKVSAGGNLIVRGGVIGREASLQAAGDVEVEYVEHGSIICGGAVTVRREVYFGEVASGRDIEFGEETSVIGSKLWAGGSLTVTHVDTETSPLSMLSAAADFQRYQRYLELLETVAGLEQKIRKIQLQLGGGATNSKLEGWLKDLQKQRAILDKLNLVPGSAEDDRNAGIRYASQQRITVRGRVLPGVIVRLGNTAARTEREFNNGSFIQVAETGTIFFAIQSGQEIIRTEVPFRVTG